MSQRFIVTPAEGDTGTQHPSPAGTPEPVPEESNSETRGDALPILRYCHEPNRYGRGGAQPGRCV